MFNWDLASSGSWKQDLERLTALRKEVTEAGREVPVMQVYLERRYGQKRDQLSGPIRAGVVSEFHQARSTFETKSSKYFEAERKGLARFDLVKVEQEKTAVKSRVEAVVKSARPDKEAGLWQIYNEGMLGDISRQRATAELFADIGEMQLSGQTIHGHPLAHSTGQYSVKAKADLEQLHYTPEMRAAAVEADLAQAEFFASWQQLEQVGAEIGVNTGNFYQAADPLYKARQEAKFTIDGKVAELLDPNSVQVTGVDLSRLGVEK